MVSEATPRKDLTGRCRCGPLLAAYVGAEDGAESVVTRRSGTSGILTGRADNSETLRPSLATHLRIFTLLGVSTNARLMSVRTVTVASCQITTSVVRNHRNAASEPSQTWRSSWFLRVLRGMRGLSLPIKKPMHAGTPKSTKQKCSLYRSHRTEPAPASEHRSRAAGQICADSSASPGPHQRCPNVCPGCPSRVERFGP